MKAMPDALVCVNRAAASDMARALLSSIAPSTRTQSVFNAFDAFKTALSAARRFCGNINKSHSVSPD